MLAGEIFDISYLATHDALKNMQRSWGLDAFDEKLYRLTHKQPMGDIAKLGSGGV